MGKLQVQPFSTRIGGDQHAVRFAEGFLDLLAFLHIHGSVQGDDRNSPGLQEFFQHLLGRHELSENQHLQVRLVFLGLKIVNPIDQSFSLGIRSSLFAANRSVEQALHIDAFALKSRDPGFQQLIKQFLAVHIVELDHFIIYAF